MFPNFYIGGIVKLLVDSVLVRALPSGPCNIMGAGVVMLRAFIATANLYSRKHLDREELYALV